MCHNAKEHKKLINRVANLDTLEGSEHKKRRQLKELHTKQDGKCYWCDKPAYLWWEITTKQFKRLGKNKIATIEHLTPKSRNGENSIDNYACACRGCNTLRGSIPEGQFFWVTRTPERFAKFKEKKRQAELERLRQKRIKQDKKLKQWLMRTRGNKLAEAIEPFGFNVSLQVFRIATHKQKTA